MRKHSTPPTSVSTVKDNRVRIIAGRWKGRKISFPDGEGLRPTGDRLRETLFNWLAPILSGARCLDLFAGSGVLGLEALSRGAAHCVLVERNPEAVRHLQSSVRLLGASDAQVVQADAKQWVASTHQVFDLVLLDPPFSDETLDVFSLMKVLRQRQLLSPSAWVYIEQSRDEVLPLLQGWHLYREQCAGRVRISLWRIVSEDADQKTFEG